MREQEQLKTQRITRLAKVREYKMKPKNYPITMITPLKYKYLNGSQHWYGKVVIH